jgi:hypothetical protein
MTRRKRLSPIAVLVGFIVVASIASKAKDTFAQEVVVRRVSAGDDTISGVVVNQSDDTVRDVRLLIRHSFVWGNEFHPGPDSPGESYFTTVRDSIPPGSSVHFDVRMPTPSIADAEGHFNTAIDVVGYTEVIPGRAAEQLQEAPTIIYRETETLR